MNTKCYIKYFFRWIDGEIIKHNKGLGYFTVIADGKQFEIFENDMVYTLPIENKIAAFKKEIRAELKEISKPLYDELLNN